MKFISSKTGQVYELPACIMVKVPDEVKRELEETAGTFTLQIAETKILKLTAIQQPWADSDWECEAGGGSYNV